MATTKELAHEEMIASELMAKLSIGFEALGAGEALAEAMLLEAGAQLMHHRGRAEAAKPLRDIADQIENPEPHSRA